MRPPIRLFGEAIASFHEYIDTYPASPGYRRCTTIWYQHICRQRTISGLDIAGKITNKDAKIEEAYQKAAYYRGQELFRNMELNAA